MYLGAINPDTSDNTFLTSKNLLEKVVASTSELICLGINVNVKMFILVIVCAKLK